jgi:hypothetical protein
MFGNNDMPLLAEAGTVKSSLHGLVELCPETRIRKEDNKIAVAMRGDRAMPGGLTWDIQESIA